MKIHKKKNLEMLKYAENT